MISNLLSMIPVIIALIIAITTHEAAHGFVAKWYGDSTAERAGRLTFNPISHVDMFGTVLLPLFLVFAKAPFMFGWAKPVPVDFDSLNPRRQGIIAVAAAGPLTNFILAFLAAALMQVNPNQMTMGNDILLMLIRINVVLGLFNLLPILPLDGGRIFGALLPKKLGEHYEKLEPYGMIILLFIIVSPLFLSIFGIKKGILQMLMEPAYRVVMKTILTVTGFTSS